MVKALLIYAGGALIGILFAWLFQLNINVSKRWQENQDLLEKEERINEYILKKQQAKKVRVFCLVLVTPLPHYTATNIKETWGKRCNFLLLMSTLENKTIPIVSFPILEGGANYPDRTKESLTYVYRHYLDQIDWVLKVDVETYVVVENLRYLLSDYKASDAVYFGSYTKPNNTPPVIEASKYGYMDRRAGYVLSREALRRYGERGLNGERICTTENIVNEDFEFGKCMKLLDVEAIDSKDKFGRGRFFPRKPTDHFHRQLKDESWLFRDQNRLFNDQTEYDDCCSDYAITFHQISSSELYTLEYLIYLMHPYGLRRTRTLI